MDQKFKVFDAHFHIIDDQFPLIPNNGYLPDTFSCENYLARMQSYQLCGGAVVSGSFQGFDQSYLLNALARLGPGFVGVTQLPANVSDQEITELNDAGVRAIRFNLRRGGSAGIGDIETLARRAYEVAGWHAEFYIDSSELDGLYNKLIQLPAICIDHLGFSKKGFKTLLKLAEHGAHVKTTGFGRVDFDVPAALRDLDSANLAALMFGTDLPSTRAARPYNDHDFNLVLETLGQDRAQQVFYDNALMFYKT